MSTTPQTPQTPESERAGGVTVAEVRVLDGPNLYFTRPAVKVSLRLPGYLALDRKAATELARLVGLGASSPGKPGTAQRQRFVMRFAAHVTRRLATLVGVQRIAVRTRTGRGVDEVVVAIPWRHREWGRATGEELGPVLEGLLEVHAQDPVDAADVEDVLEAAAERVRETDPGPASQVVVPQVPVVSITGTNGKTTTTRLVAHISMTAGFVTAWSSTSGVVVMGETIEAGDYSGPSGARAVLATPGLEIGVLETARGGMLLRGMGVASNDVSVVTNVTADHLGLQGIDTLDQLAEVKAIVTTVTKPDGWVVLNGDDPRVWAMRHRIRARPWAFSLDPDSPALRESLDAGGRGVTLLDGEIVVLSRGKDPDRLARVVDVPVTLSGLSRFNIANALAGAAAALGLGMPRSAVVEGLKSFAPDPVLNEGRLNTYSVPVGADDAAAAERGTATVILDMAHNEAGLEALLEVAHGLKTPGARVHVGIGATGDRPDEAIEGLGEIAGKSADRVVIAHKPKYLRGRTIEDIDGHLRAGLARVGTVDVETYETELGGLEALLDAARPGDVVAYMAHDERPRCAARLVELGGSSDDPRTIRRKVVEARGGHELDAEIAELWALDDAAERVSRFRALVGDRPRDLRLAYELACALSEAGEDSEAVELHVATVARGLREPFRHRAQLRAAAGVRTLGRLDEALDLLDEVSTTHPGSVAAAALRGLVLADAGREREAVADLLDALLDHAADEDATSYRAAVRAQAEALREG
ncbi:tetratricopeptide repeat protein [Lapillicoccus jejuensis]|uniref:Cyanophycin synthetase n=1 Tax=Lapillicoccus jejuensis TaxID=402171 RepID=A0A542E4F7_9MICO|nr:tetratricopeptide repeat protein [Lapillicoccus jejuensis]TQJ10197.1 cyanophycin synthetase [Lapillicoccus jejuensis]